MTDKQALLDKSTISAAAETTASRRNMTLGVLGAIGGAALLQGCSTDVGTDGSTPYDPESVAAAATGTSFKWADTIGTVAVPGDLRGITGSTSLHTVVVGGFWAIGDGGGGIFHWDSASAIADDGGTIVNPTAHSGNGRWKRVYSGAIDVRWFGAKGDGTTNDRAAILAAATAASMGGILLSPGTYALASSLIIPCGVAFANGAKLSPASNTTLTMSGTILAPQGSQLFVMPPPVSPPVTAVSFTVLTASVDVRWFGAKGDGVTDCSPAINAALDAIAGGEVRFPPGQYRFTQTIRNGDKAISFVGDGFASLLSFDPPTGHYGDDAFVITGYNAGSYGGTGTCIRNLRLEAMHSNNGTGGARLFGCGIKLFAALFVTLENVWVRYFDAPGGRGILLQDAPPPVGGGNASPTQDTTTYGVVIQGCDIGMEVLSGGPTSNHSLSINQCTSIGLHLVGGSHFHWYGGLAQCTATKATVLIEPNAAGAVASTWLSGIHFEGGNGPLIKALPWPGASGTNGLTFVNCHLSYTGTQNMIDMDGVVYFTFDTLIMYGPMKLRRCVGRLINMPPVGPSSLSLDIDASNILEWAGWDGSSATPSHSIGTSAPARAGVALDLSGPIALPEYPAGSEPMPAIKNMVVVNSSSGRLRLCTVAGNPGTWVDM